MTQTQNVKSALPHTEGTGSTITLDAIRVAAQDLHSAISDAAVKHDTESKERLRPIAPRPAAIVASVKAMIGAQTEVAKKHLGEVVALLEESEAQIATSLKTTGQAFHIAVRQALADSRRAAQKISELVAETRSAQAKQRNRA